MPKKKRPEPIYQRGQFKLFARPNRNHEIIWYDKDRKRERSASAGTAHDGEAIVALDRMYLESEGVAFCPTCGQPTQGEHAPLLSSVIADYLLSLEGRAGFNSARGRLSHVVDYIADKARGATVPQINDVWVDGFRQWLLKRPVISPTGKILRERSIGHVEGCVMQLAAAINSLPNHRAAFDTVPLKEAAATPLYRADIPTLAAMFRFALDRAEQRQTLLRYLRAAVATWARPDAILDITSKQWASSANVLDLNPPGRRQTKKYRPAVPIARQFAPELDALDGIYLPVVTLRHAWDPMRKALDLPGEGQAGPKLIRRSIATIARKRIGEQNWAQGEMMLGHRKASTSDIYALPDPANLGLALSVTEEIIDEIEALCPGSYRKFTATGTRLSVVEGGLSA